MTSRFRRKLRFIPEPKVKTVRMAARAAACAVPVAVASAVRARKLRLKKPPPRLPRLRPRLLLRPRLPLRWKLVSSPSPAPGARRVRAAPRMWKKPLPATPDQAAGYRKIRKGAPVSGAPFLFAPAGPSSLCAWLRRVSPAKAPGIRILPELPDTPFCCQFATLYEPCHPSDGAGARWGSLRPQGRGCLPNGARSPARRPCYGWSGGKEFCE